MLMKLTFVLALAAIAVAIPAYSYDNAPYDEEAAALHQYVAVEDLPEFEPLYLVRTRREVEVNPHVNKQDGTTNVGGSVTHRGDNHEVTGHWNQNVRGPGRGRPNYGVRGSFKW